MNTLSLKQRNFLKGLVNEGCVPDFLQYDVIDYDGGTSYRYTLTSEVVIERIKHIRLAREYSDDDRIWLMKLRNIWLKEANKEKRFYTVDTYKFDTLNEATHYSQQVGLPVQVYSQQVTYGKVTSNGDIITHRVNGK